MSQWLDSCGSVTTLPPRGASPIDSYDSQRAHNAVILHDQLKSH